MKFHIFLAISAAAQTVAAIRLHYAGDTLEQQSDNIVVRPTRPWHGPHQASSTSLRTSSRQTSSKATSSSSQSAGTSTSKKSTVQTTRPLTTRRGLSSSSTTFPARPTIKPQPVPTSAFVLQVIRTDSTSGQGPFLQVYPSFSDSSYFFGTDTPKEYADNFVYVPAQQRIHDVSQTEWTSIHWETSPQVNGSSLLNFITSTPTDTSGGLTVVNDVLLSTKQGMESPLYLVAAEMPGRSDVWALCQIEGFTTGLTNVWHTPGDMPQSDCARVALNVQLI